MIQIVADNIISGLGRDTGENLRALREGRISLKENAGFRVPGDGKVFLSVMDDSFIEPSVHEEDMTRLEMFMVSSVKRACGRISHLLGDSSTIFVFSTAKGNVRYLAEDERKVPLWHSAKVVSGYFGNPNDPVTVSTACTSGVTAIIVAKRLLEAGLYKTAVVVGADEITEFVVSGFASLMALSDELCRPFDIMRHGLNLGEAAGCLVLRRADSKEDMLNPDGYFKTPQLVASGAMASDAFHISGPSKTGEGLYRAVMKTLSLPYGAKAETCLGEAFINPHGTATLYNDQMESVAFSRSGLDDMPMIPLKGYFGHTLGASGVIETILCCHFLDEGWIPGAAGYSEPGCFPSPNISSEPRPISASWFLKTNSGFGGSNAAIKVEKLGDSFPENGSRSGKIDIRTIKSFNLEYTGDVKEYLASLYRASGLSYPKFHKMDLLCKAGVLAADSLLEVTEGNSDTALVFVNSVSSLAADREYLSSIAEDDFFPSPSVFVYTLPNIVTGEISIRHKLFGECVFFVEEELNRERALDYVRCLFREGSVSRVLFCWDESLDGRCSLRADLIGMEKNGKLRV